MGHLLSTLLHNSFSFIAPIHLHDNKDGQTTDTHKTYIDQVMYIKQHII